MILTILMCGFEKSNSVSSCMAHVIMTEVKNIVQAKLITQLNQTVLGCCIYYIHWCEKQKIVFHGIFTSHFVHTKSRGPYTSICFFCIE